MQSILSTDYYVHFQDKAYTALNSFLESETLSKLFILVDSNTRKDCLQLFLDKTNLPETIEVLEIEPGEEQKHISTCNFIWNQLSERGADRKSLLINLGGGVITDMGGFAASTFKRGIRFINVPTTLLSMVDASVGGKTGVDLGVLKNQIGLFSNPEMVLVDTVYLKTVSERELKSGLAEIIKYGFTFDRNLWETIKTFNKIEMTEIGSLVHRSVEIKNEVVLKDLLEQNLRKSLNFGHTIGHAIESYFLQSEEKSNLTHGEAIAIGMIVELYFSSVLYQFPRNLTDELKNFVREFYGIIELKTTDLESITELMKYDKKNLNGKINFVLVKDLEKCVLDVQVPAELLSKGIDYYLS